MLSSVRSFHSSGDGARHQHAQGGSPAAIDDMLEFSARQSIAPITETFPMSKVNDAFERLRSGKVRYRLVLENDRP
jgi:D-arabinose 1-dehydrogenase-like Zn-dependent alcohol dehydrogenase